MGTPSRSIAGAAAPGVYISDALKVRPRRPVDAEVAMRAMHDLASTMAMQPGDLLPRLVELAMELTAGVAAGLSLFEPEPASPGVFRWRHLHGILAPFEDATTPRNHSPCGVCLDRDSVTLSSHPEVAYDWIAAEHLIIPEVLLVPLRTPDAEAIGTLWVVAAQEGLFNQDDADLLAELGGFAGIALKMIRRQDQLTASLDEQQLIAAEMSHRIRNVFAMTDGMIQISARHADSPGDLAAALSGRIRALAGAHAMVASSVGAISDAEVDLGELVAAIVKVHRSGGDSDRIRLCGKPVACGARAANSLALVIHELATNAVKYGALASPDGFIEVDWRHEDGDFVLFWRERGGPPVKAPPDRAGFGTKLVDRTITQQFAGSIVTDWSPEGLTKTIRFPGRSLAN